MRRAVGRSVGVDGERAESRTRAQGLSRAFTAKSPTGAAASPTGSAESTAESRGHPLVRDLRGSCGAELCWPPGDIVILSGLPGGGKSTLLRRVTAASGALYRIDSQDVRERWERLPRWLPYAVIRPLVRVEHYLGLWRVLREPGSSVAVHDCGQRPWVRRWLGWEAERRGGQAHLLLLDVRPDEAWAGQLARHRLVSARAFERHRRAMAVLRAELAAGRLPRGCSSALLLDRPAAATVRRVCFEKGAHPVGGPPDPRFPGAGESAPRGPHDDTGSVRSQSGTERDQKAVAVTPHEQEGGTGDRPGGAERASSPPYLPKARAG